MSCSDEGSGEEGNNAVQAVFGICLGIAGSFGINIGNNIQAVGLRLKGVGDEEETVRRTAAQPRKQGDSVFLVRRVTGRRGDGVVEGVTVWWRFA